MWQWSWVNSKAKNLLEVTGRSLKKRMAMWEEENIARFQEQIPCNLQDLIKNARQIPGEF